MNQDELKQNIIKNLKKNYYKYKNLPTEYLEDWDIMINACWVEKSIVFRNRELLKNEEFLLTLLKNKTAINIFKKSIPFEMWDNKNVVKYILSKDPCFFSSVSERLKNDSEILWLVVDHVTTIGSYINDDLKKNKEFMRKVFQISTYNFQYADESIRADKEEVQDLISKNVMLFQYVSENLKDDKEFVVNILKDCKSLKHSNFISLLGPNLRKEKDLIYNLIQLGSYLKDVDPSLENDEDIVTLAILKDRTNIKYAGNLFKNNKTILNNYIKKNYYYCLKYFNLSLWDKDLLVNLFNSIEISDNVYNNILCLEPIIKNTNILYDVILRVKPQMKNNMYILRLFMLNKDFSNIYKELQFPIDLKKAIDKKGDLIDDVNYLLLKNVLNNQVNLNKNINKTLKF